MNNIEILKEGGIKCDNPSCDYKDPSVSFEDLEGYLGKPCPKCGENLLTEKDLQNAKDLMNAVNLVNSMSPEEMEELEKVISQMEGYDELVEELGQNVILEVGTHDKITMKIKKDVSDSNRGEDPN